MLFPPGMYIYIYMYNLEYYIIRLRYQPQLWWWSPDFGIISPRWTCFTQPRSAPGTDWASTKWASRLRVVSWHGGRHRFWGTWWKVGMISQGTLAQTNIAPKNGWSEYIGILHAYWGGLFFSVYVSFGGVAHRVLFQKKGTKWSVVSRSIVVTCKVLARRPRICFQLNHACIH